VLLLFISKPPLAELGWSIMLLRSVRKRYILSREVRYSLGIIVSSIAREGSSLAACSEATSKKIICFASIRYALVMCPRALLLTRIVRVRRRHL
jgi:hypothetical protein